MESELSAPTPSTHRLTRPWLIGLLAFPLVLHGLTYLWMPGYLIPYLRNEIARLIWIATWLWQIMGMAILYRLRFQSGVLFGFVCTLFVIVFVLPILIVPMLGPTQVTSLGPF